MQAKTFGCKENKSVRRKALLSSSLINSNFRTTDGGGFGAFFYLFVIPLFYFFIYVRYLKDTIYTGRTMSAVKFFRFMLALVRTIIHTLQYHVFLRKKPLFKSVLFVFSTIKSTKVNNETEVTLQMFLQRFHSEIVSNTKIQIGSLSNKQHSNLNVSNS